MNRVTNPLLLIMPEEMMGPVLALMIVTGGLLLIIGFRRSGLALIGLAIGMPIITVLVEALMNDLFNSMPESWVQPIAWIMMAVIYLMLAGAFLTLLIGQKGIDEAKGQLLADAIKGLLKLAFKWPVMLVWMSLLGYAVLTTSR